MQKYLKIHSQFIEFLEKTRNKIYDSNEIKLINLILDNFDVIAGSGTAAGKRAKIINELIQTKATTTSEVLNLNKDEENSQKAQHLVRLISLETEKFRGFTEKCIFNLEKQFNLVYGPNGSGKSSFCEALEYVLLGYIQEADIKRIALPDYIKNTHYSLATNPILKGVDENGELITIEPNYDLYNFSFVEKCRIDSFVRISAYTAASQAERLAILFGLDDFNNFVKEFTDNIEQYIPTENKKQKEFDLKALTVATHKSNTEKYGQELKKIEIDKETIIKERQFGKSFAELKEWINGSSSHMGRLQLVNEELQSVSANKIEFTKVDDLFFDLSKLKYLANDFNETQKLFDFKINEINLTNLYTSVMLFENLLSEKCPVCETPIKSKEFSVLKNPYENAKEKLLELKNAADIQQKRLGEWQKLIKKNNELIQVLTTFIQHAKNISKQIGLILPKELRDTNPDIKTSHLFIPKLEGFINEMEQKKSLFEECELEFNKRNNDLLQFETKKHNLLAEKNTLESLKSRIDEIQTNETTFSGLLKNAAIEIGLFETANEKLLHEITLENESISNNIIYISTYKSFKEKLVRYKDALPVELAKDLNILVKEIYNFINQDDQPFELFHSIELPTKSSELIKISFQDSPKAFQNALHVLSEGHIKCLGLAILLAKCVKTGLHFIIFDDIVNAIDDDHRGRIRDLLFTHPYFKDIQIILTSHSEEFMKDIENINFTREEYEKSLNRITFLERSSKTIQYKDTSANYLKKAEEFVGLHNKRDCLSSCRRALENISESIWKRLVNFENRRYNIELKVPLRAPNKKPDLMNVISGLRVCAASIDNVIIQEIIKLLEWFEGLKTSTPRIWEFLNKGTHDESDREDFDSLVVKQILDNTTVLDTAAKKKWK